MGWFAYYEWLRSFYRKGPIPNRIYEYSEKLFYEKNGFYRSDYQKARARESITSLALMKSIIDVNNY